MNATITYPTSCLLSGVQKSQTLQTRSVFSPLPARVNLIAKKRLSQVLRQLLSWQSDNDESK